MKTILHLGAHRCATTTFQHFLRAEAPALAGAGIAVWEPRRTRRGLLDGLFAGPDAATPALDRRAHRAAGRVGVERARLARAGTERLLVSEESLLGSIRANLRAGALYPDLALRLARLRDALAGEVARIGLAIRPTESYWVSALGHALARGHRMPSVHELAALAARPRGWRHVVGDIAAAFPEAELVVWRHDAVATHPDRTLSLLLGEEIAARGPVPVSASNASPGFDDLAEILRHQGRDPVALGLTAAGWSPFNARARETLRWAWDADLDWLSTGPVTFHDVSCEPAPCPPAQRTTRQDRPARKADARSAPRPASGGHDDGRRRILV